MENAGLKLVKAGDDDDLLYPDLNPLDDDDFVLILARLSDALREAAVNQEARALRDALDALDVNWSTLSPAAADRVIQAAQAVVSGSVDKVLPRASRVFEQAARAIIPATKIKTLETERLAIGAALSRPDKETGAALLRQQELFIRDEFGRRAEAAGARARQIVAAGVERGLGQEQMAAQLAADITLRQLGRARAYWEVVATAFSNSARTSTQLNTFVANGILKFRFIAVLDEVTTDICRYLDKKVFLVSDAISQQRRVEKLRRPDDIKNARPWVKRGFINERPALYYERDGERHVVANIRRSGVGQLDDPGEFTGGLSDEELVAAGVFVPPLHGRCRSTIVSEE